MSHIKLGERHLTLHFCHHLEANLKAGKIISNRIFAFLETFQITAHGTSSPCNSAIKRLTIVINLVAIFPRVAIKKQLPDL